MNLHFSYKAAKSADVDREIQQHVEKLQRRLKVFSPDLVHLHGTVDCGAGPKIGCEVTLNLRLPTGQLAAQDSGTNAQAALKKAFGELISQLNKHKDMLRNEHNWVRDKAELSPPEPGVSETVPPTGEVARRTNGHAEPEEQETARSENGKASVEDITAATFDGEGTPLQREIRAYLSSRLPRLERYVARELRLREGEGEMAPGAVTDTEVLDEVVMSALSTEERPGKLPLERWLFRLALQTVRRMTKTDDGLGEKIPLEKAAGEQNVTGSDEAFLQFHQPGEMLIEQDVIADVRQGNPEDRAASDETIDQLEESLSGAKPAEREAFVLFAIEGFTVPEIVEITDRSEQQVRSDILSARDHLMKKLPPSNSLKRKLLQYSSVA
jgi:DNA-directed RNA polymerase specialized sigma24 family protein/ribosome-associated translation inhibitor RaiA